MIVLLKGWRAEDLRRLMVTSFITGHVFTTWVIVDPPRVQGAGELPRMTFAVLFSPPSGGSQSARPRGDGRILVLGNIVDAASVRFSTPCNCQLCHSRVPEVVTMSSSRVGRDVPIKVERDVVSCDREGAKNIRQVVGRWRGADDRFRPCIPFFFLCA